MLKKIKNFKQLISQFVWNIAKAKQREIYIETIDQDKVTEAYVVEILENKIYCGKFIYLKTSINGLIKIKRFLFKSINLSIGRYRA